MNKFIGIGRLAKDPETRTTQSGKTVCTFTLAMDDGWGENKHSTFLPIVIWGKLGEVCGSNLTKGRQVSVEGRVNVRNYDTDNGKRYVTEIIADRIKFLDRAKGTATGKTADQFGEAVPDENIPF